MWHQSPPPPPLIHVFPCTTNLQELLFSLSCNFLIHQMNNEEGGKFICANQLTDLLDFTTPLDPDLLLTASHTHTHTHSLTHSLTHSHSTTALILPSCLWLVLATGRQGPAEHNEKLFSSLTLLRVLALFRSRRAVHPAQRRPHPHASVWLCRSSRLIPSFFRDFPRIRSCGESCRPVWMSKGLTLRKPSIQILNHYVVSPGTNIVLYVS